MLEVLQQKDGRYVVRDVGGIALDDVVGVFDSKRERRRNGFSIIRWTPKQAIAVST